MTPYVGWLRWHHYAGLLFGVITFTWTFSGLLTMTPWNCFQARSRRGDQVAAIRGDGVDLARFTLSPVDAVRCAAESLPAERARADAVHGDAVLCGV